MLRRLPDTAKNLDQLEGVVLGPPTYESYLVSTCHRLAVGDFYPGDLLRAVLSVSAEYWRGEWEWRDRLCRVLAQVERVPKELTAAVTAFEATSGPTMR